METCRVKRADGGQIVLARVGVARSLGPRVRGLMGRRTLHPAEGLLIPSCGGVHTFFMRFPIDVVYLDSSCRVRKIVAELAPWRISCCVGAETVLEASAGWARAVGVAVGDGLCWSPTGGRPGT